MKCEECDNVISDERVEFGCVTCFSCASKKRPVKGFMVYDNLTAVGIQIVPAEKYDSVKHLFSSSTNNIPVIES